MRILYLIIIFFIFNLGNEAYSLPGWTIKNTENWIKNHKFLAPSIIQGMESFSAKRELKGHYFIQVNFEPLDEKSIYSVSMDVSKREYNKETESWEAKEYSNIWARENKSAILLLTKIYGDTLSKDFEKSKNIYSGDEYTIAEPTSYYRHKIPDNFTELKKKLPDYMKNNDLVFLTGHSAFYKGKLFAYESTREGLKIFPLNSLNINVDILKYNQKVYKKYLQFLDNKKKQEEEVKNKYKPADIEINEK